MKQNEITIFPDTNILLHYPQIDQIDWLQWCNSKSVKIVFCLKVIGELDRHKNDPYLSKRAKNAIKKIKIIEQKDGHIRDNVFLEIFNEELHNAKISADETIIQQVLNYKNNHPDEDVYIMTEDYGMQLLCRGRVNTIEPDKTKKQESPESKFQKENRRLKEEIAELKNQTPVLDLFVTQPNTDKINPPEPFKVEYYSVCFANNSIVDVEYNAFLEAIKNDPYSNMYGGFNNSEYKRELSSYLEQYNNTMQELSISFPFTLLIKNTGSVPAESIKIKLEFPKIFSFIAHHQQHYGKIPNIPPIPHLPIDCSATRRMVRFANLKKISQYYNFNIATFDSKGQRVKFSANKNILMNISIDKLPHDHDVKLDCIAGVISKKEAKTFELACNIFAENMPQRKNKKIPFIFEK